MTTRRQFVQSTIAGVAALNLDLPRLFAQPSKPMRILFLGGTGFIGPHQVEYALSRGHKLTLFNRGKSNPNLFPGVEKLEGDRNGQLDALKGRQWDAVIDNSGYVPRHVRLSAELLKGNVGQYVFVSTLGVYQAMYDGSWPAGGIHEGSPRSPLPEPDSEEVGKYYGQLKAVCEDEVTKVFGDKATIIRPGLIVGPGDPTDRFTYFPVRAAKGGEMLAPGSASDPILYTDARDLSAFCVRVAEEKIGGPFNIVGPRGTLTMGEFLDACKKESGSNVKYTWVPGDFLEKHQVHPMGLFPWVSPTGPAAGASHFQRERAFKAGLQFRPVAETVRDTLKWFRSLPAERQAKLDNGVPALTAAKEKEVLAAWHQQAH